MGIKRLFDFASFSGKRLRVQRVDDRIIMSQGYNNLVDVVEIIEDSLEVVYKELVFRDFEGWFKELELLLIRILQLIFVVFIS